MWMNGQNGKVNTAFVISRYIYELVIVERSPQDDKSI